MNNYKDRLKIPLEGGIFNFRTPSGILVATRYDRIVIGARGPYIEFSDGCIFDDVIHIPDDQRWRITSSQAFYNEYRTITDNIKVYNQKKTVDYADYLVGKWYISPFELRDTMLNELIEPIKVEGKQLSLL